MENIILNDIVLNDKSISTIKLLQDNDNSELKMNIAFIQEVKDFIVDVMSSEKDNQEKIVLLAKMNRKLVTLSNSLESLKK